MNFSTPTEKQELLKTTGKELYHVFKVIRDQDTGKVLFSLETVSTSPDVALATTSAYIRCMGFEAICLFRKANKLFKVDPVDESKVIFL
jgi:hypothetical protein